MIFFFFDSTLILVFLIFAVALGLQAAQFLHGIAGVVGTIIFIAEVIASIYFIASKIYYRKKYGYISGSDIFMTVISSALCLFCSFLYLHDLSGYDGGTLGDLICFVVAMFFLAGPWLYCVAGWLEAVGEEDGFAYRGLFTEILAVCVIFFVFFGL